MERFEFSSRRARERAEEESFLDAKFCNVAAAMIGAAAIGAVSTSMQDGPDTSGMNQAAQSEAQLSRDQLDWSKQIYAETAPDRKEATRIALEQAQLQTEAAKKQIAASDDTLAYQKSTFRPAEQKLAADAMAYDTPARREEAARAATADVETALAGQREATMRDMERHGALPTSGRVAAMSGMMDIGAAKAKAGAANAARKEIEAIGTARVGDVANLGRGIASSQVAQLQSGVQTGNAAVANGQAPVNIAAAGNGIMTQGFQGAQTSMASAGSIYGNIAKISNDNSANTNAMMGGLGQSAGKIAAAYYGI
jgi:hypothetical protein